MANDWIQVQITDINGGDNVLEWLNVRYLVFYRSNYDVFFLQNMTNDAGSDSLTQGSNEVLYGSATLQKRNNIFCNIHHPAATLLL